MQQRKILLLNVRIMTLPLFEKLPLWLRLPPQRILFSDHPTSNMWLAATETIPSVGFPGPRSFNRNVV